MFWRKKNQAKTDIQETYVAVSKPVARPIDFTKEASPEEVETVSVIASAILAGDQLDASIKVVSVKEVNHDKEAAALIVASVMAHDQPESVFRLVSIQEQ